jgi:hypothetical protein
MKGGGGEAARVRQLVQVQPGSAPSAQPSSAPSRLNDQVSAAGVGLGETRIGVLTNKLPKTVPSPLLQQ